MTAVLGMATDTEMLMLGDGLWAAGCCRFNGGPKVFTYGAGVLGGAGMLRHMQIVQHHVEPPLFTSTATDPMRAVIEWVERAREVFKLHGALGKEKDTDLMHAGECSLLGSATTGRSCRVGSGQSPSGAAGTRRLRPCWRCSLMSQAGWTTGSRSKRSCSALLRRPRRWTWMSTRRTR